MRLNRIRESRVNAISTVEVYVGSVGINDNIRGQWLPLPIEVEQLTEIEQFIRNGEEDVELAIIDVDCESKAVREAILASGSIYSINGLLLRLHDDYQSYEIEAAILVSEIVGVPLDEALDAVDECDYLVLHDVSDADDLGRAYVEEGLFGFEIPEEMERFFDYEALGEELEIEGWAISREHKAAARML